MRSDWGSADSFTGHASLEGRDEHDRRSATAALFERASRAQQGRREITQAPQAQTPSGSEALLAFVIAESEPGDTAAVSLSDRFGVVILALSV